MIISSDPSRLKPENGSLATIGNFDGVHAGHAHLLSEACRIAVREQLSPIAVTFWPHPRQVLGQSGQEPPLTPAGERRKLLERAGVERLLELPFTPQMAALSAEEFIRQWLLPLNVQRLVVGYDFRMGHNSACEELEGIASRTGIRLTRIPPFLQDGSPTSSTRIREALKEGRVERAATLLGRLHSISGVVEHGFARGRDLGFPTANLGQVEGFLPADGVYAAWAATKSALLPAVTNIGCNPTFDGDRRTIESFLLEAPGDLYGRNLTLYFVARLRGEKRFSTPDELVAQITADIAHAREILSDPANAPS